MSNLFKQPKPPEPKAPAPMPDPDDPALIEAKRRATFEQMSKGGRSSTILTGRSGGGTGFDNYSSTRLGAG